MVSNMSEEINNVTKQNVSEVNNYSKFEDYATEFLEIVERTKKIGRINITSGELRVLLRLFDIFNLVDRDTYAINNIPMSKILIPTQMKQMIYPVAVTLGGKNHLVKDYLARPATTACFEEFSLSKYNSLIDGFLSNFKTNGAVETVTLDSLKEEEKELLSIIDDVAVDGCVKPLHDYSIPIPVTTNLKYTDGCFYTEPVKSTVIEAFRDICRNISKL